MLIKTLGVAAVTLIGCASASALTVSIYSGLTGAPAAPLLGPPGSVYTPYTGLVGSFYSADINFAPNFLPSTYGVTTPVYTSGTYAGAPLFGAIITGNIVSGGANYTFNLTSDDGSYLYVDGVLVVNNGGAHSATSTASGSIALTAGTHSILVDYFEAYGLPSELRLALPQGVTYATPDGGSTVALLGCALGAFGVFSRRFRK
jgi:hypothetical protein